MEWINIRKQKPPHREKVWLYSTKQETTFIGYYESSLGGFFNENGSGVGCTYWTKIVPPDFKLPKEIISKP